MKTIIKSLIVFFILSLISVFGLACLWDEDTIEMERQRFPNVLELITGNFVRHSTEFYEWRINDRLEKLKSQPHHVAFYDDLAVAYDKVGKSKKAIQIMLQKESIKAGLYETYANLGTFYIHDNQLEQGLVYINKAIEINPEAHFGREVYQKYLVEYILEKKKGKHNNFYDFLTKKLPDKSKDKRGELTKKASQKAVKGVLGMMRFGHYDSPVLLEALGNLLIRNYDNNAVHLAFLAYRQASPKTRNREIRTSNSEANGLPLSSFFEDHEEYDNNRTRFIKTLNYNFKKNILAGKKLYRQIRQDEIKWIKDGKNPEIEFKKKYYNHNNSSSWFLFLLGSLGLVLVLGFGVYRKRRN